MKLKKAAVRALIILAVVVALCMFFSGTVRTITTPKVKFVTPRSGKFTEDTELIGKLAFPDTEKIKLDVPEGVSVEIVSVKKLAGYEVEAGDVIFEARVAEYDKTMQTLRDGYDTADSQLVDLEQKNKNLTLRRTDEMWASAYFARTDARQALLDAQLEAQSLASIEKLTLPEDLTAPEGASDALVKACEAYAAAKTAFDEAEAALTQANRYSVSDEARAYITEKRKLTDQMANYEKQMLELRVVNAGIAQIVAPRDGYITEMQLKAGDTYDPSQSAYTMNAEGTLPVLRVDLSDTELAIAKGNDVTFPGKNGNTQESKVLEIGFTVDGAKYADVELTKKDIKAMGGAYAASTAEVTVTFSYKAKENSSLLPSAAVRGSGEDRYVYVIREKYTAFGTKSLVLEKMTVTVLMEAGGTTSLSDDITYYTVAYMEDRPVSENGTVMEYVD